MNVSERDGETNTKKSNVQKTTTEILSLTAAAGCGTNFVLQLLIKS